MGREGHVKKHSDSLGPFKGRKTLEKRNHAHPSTMQCSTCPFFFSSSSYWLYQLISSSARFFFFFLCSLSLSPTRRCLFDRSEKRANTFLFSYRMRWCCRVCTVRTVLWAMVLRVALVANWKSNWRGKRTRAPRCRLVRQSTAVPAHLMPVPFLFLLLLTDVTHHLHFFFSFLLLSLLISGFRLFRPTSCK